MLFSARWLVIVLLMAGGLRAAPVETEVEVAPGVMGVWATPDGTDTPPARAVLLFHGWAGKRDEVGDIYRHLAARLAEQGTASLRIDFRGEGERNGHRLTSTFAGRVADAEASLAWVRKTCPEAKVGVVGFSLGGATAMGLVGKHPEAVTSLVLWSSAADLGADFFASGEMSAVQREAIEKGEAVFQSFAPLTITREHLLGFIGYDVLTPLAAYHGALLGLRGSDDMLPRYEDRIMAVAGAAPEQAVVIGGADHIFHVFDPEKSSEGRVLDLTLRWFAETL